MCDGVTISARLDVAVIVSDTFGRPWRRGVTDVAIGSAGIIPVLDLSSTLGVYSSEGTAGNIVIVETGAATFGILVDEVDEVLSVSAEQVDELPNAAGCRGRIAKTDDALIVILDLDSLGLSDGAALAA